MDTPCALCVEKGRNCTYTKILRTRGPGLNSIPSKIVENPLLASNSTIPSKSLKLKTKVSNLQDFDADTPLQSTTSILSPLSQQSHSIISPPAIETSIEAWKKSEFLSKIIIDCKGNSGSILDLYFNFPYQHLPMFSKVWLTNNIEDVPMHVLHIIYMLVLTNARQSLINGRMTAKPHEDFVQKQVDIHINNCDPFLVSTILNLAVYYFYIQDFEKSSLEFAKAVKYAQLLKLHIDVDLEWTCDSGRTLGSEIGMDKQFLRSIWFLIYQWDTYTMLLGHGNTLVESSIPDKVLAAYIPPNIGDPSNVPLK